MIIVISEWDDRTQTIVATGQLKDNENSVVFTRDDLGEGVGSKGIERKECLLDEDRQRPGGRCTQGGGAEELAARLQSWIGLHTS